MSGLTPELFFVLGDLVGRTQYEEMAHGHEVGSPPHASKLSQLQDSREKGKVPTWMFQSLAKHSVSPHSATLHQALAV